MENLRTVKFAFILLGGMLLFVLAIPFFLFAYSDETTHPALTDEIVDHFNRYYSDKALSVSQKELVKLGSIEEDSEERWLRHFYDPIRNRGLVVEDTEAFRSRELAAIIGGTRSEWPSSKEWAQDTLTQAGLLGNSAYGSIFSFFSSQSDFSWERAIYEYAWGDKNRAVLALGHILHLIEDASVPDHTRNDPHPHITEWFSTFNESPYEIWTKKFTPGNFTASINASPIILGSLDAYFDSMARYSNGNFFSKDTILNGYDLPSINRNNVTIEKLSDGESYEFALYDDKFGGRYKLLLLGKRKIGSFEETFSLKDSDNLILTDYWSHLSRQAILHGAGVMKLFFDEVVREQQTKTLYNKNRSWWQKAGDGIASIWAGFTNNTTSSAGLLATVNSAVIEVSPPARGETSAMTGGDETKIEASPPDGGEASTVAGNETRIEVSPPAGGAISAQNETGIKVSPPAGGETLTTANSPLVFSAGGAGPRRETGIEVSPPVGGETSTAAPPDTTSPDAPIITAPTETTQTTSRVTFSGTAEAGATILTDFDDATTTVMIEVSPPAGGETSPTAGGETSTLTGTWALALDLSQGTATINFFAKDSAGNTSTGTQKTIFVDSEAPSVNLSIIECAASLSQDGCLIATIMLSLAWSSGAEDLAAYELSCAKDGNNPCANFSYEPNATNTTFIAENNHTYIFTATARDTNGNESSQKRIAEVRTTPIVINEIAWMGTASSSEDEWIELKNISGQAINFNNAWVLKTDDAMPSVTLSGSIPAGGYYLLERTDDATVSDIAADQLYGNDGSDWALNNTGEVLTLAYGSTTIDQTPALNICGSRRNRWCAGDATSRATMERIDPLIVGTNAGNWATNNGLIKNGKDAGNNSINGTPKSRNSANYDLVRLWYSHGEPQTLTLPQAVYVIDSSGFTIPIGKTFALQPGAIIKFVSANEPSLRVNGTLKAEGTAENPVVFTSIYDDAYGGDTNGDGICNLENASSTAVCPHPGGWKQIYISPDSANTVINHAIIRYGGKWFNNMSFRAMLAVDRAAVELKNSVVEHSWGHGLYAANSDATIENNTFRRNASHEGDLGFLIGGGNPAMRGNTSSFNSAGGSLSGVGGVFSDNVFTNNAREALMLSGAVPTISSIIATGNGVNGIYLQSIPLNFTFQAGLPYIIESQPILSSGTYAFESGAVIKFRTSSANLTFDVPVNSIGTGISPIVFTSFYDDTYGGDTNNDGVCNPTDASSTAACPYAGAWRGLKFTTGANGSTLDNIIVRYGGSHSDWAGIKAESASITLQNSVIEQNSRKGIWLFNSATTTIINTIIRNHTKPDNDLNVSGLYLAGSHADIGGLTFRDNTIGINAPDALAGGSSITVTGQIDLDISNITSTIPPMLVP